MGLFIVLVPDRPDALADRLAHRQEHLDYWTDKPVKVAGALLTDDSPTGSAFLIEAESEAAVRAMIAADPFTLHHIFVGEAQVLAMRPAIGEWIAAA